MNKGLFITRKQHWKQHFLNRDECNKFGGQKVTVQGHGGITYAGIITVEVEDTVLNVLCCVTLSSFFGCVLFHRSDRSEQKFAVLFHRSEQSDQNALRSFSPIRSLRSI